MSSAYTTNNKSPTELYFLNDNNIAFDKNSNECSAGFNAIASQQEFTEAYKEFTNISSDFEDFKLCAETSAAVIDKDFNDFKLCAEISAAVINENFENFKLCAETSAAVINKDIIDFKASAELSIGQKAITGFSYDNENDYLRISFGSGDELTVDASKFVLDNILSDAYLSSYELSTGEQSTALYLVVQLRDSSVSGITSKTVSCDVSSLIDVYKASGNGIQLDSDGQTFKLDWSTVGSVSTTNSLSGHIDNLSSELSGHIDNLSAELKAEIDARAMISVDGVATSNFYCKHISQEEYHDLVLSVGGDTGTETVNPNTIYFISSDDLCMYGASITDLKAGTNPADAATFGQLSGVKFSIREAIYKTLSSAKAEENMSVKLSSVVQCLMDVYAALA